MQEDTLVTSRGTLNTGSPAEVISFTFPSVSLMHILSGIRGRDGSLVLTMESRDRKEKARKFLARHLSKDGKTRLRRKTGGGGGDNILRKRKRFVWTAHGIKGT